MKAAAIVLAIALAGALVFAAVRFADETFAPLLLNSRVERLGERNLPKIVIERGSVIYCRMKADDFRFPLPPGSRAANPVVTGGFDTVDGSVEALFDGTNTVSAGAYESLLLGKVQAGGYVTAEEISKGLLIKFHYFGDR